MARIIEQSINIKFSRIVKDSHESDDVLSDETLTMLITTLPSVCEEVIDESSIIVEIE
jgi:hypothetical protein